MRRRISPLTGRMRDQKDAKRRRVADVGQKTRVSVVRWCVPRVSGRSVQDSTSLQTS